MKEGKGSLTAVCASFLFTGRHFRSTLVGSSAFLPPLKTARYPSSFFSLQRSILHAILPLHSAPTAPTQTHAHVLVSLHLIKSLTGEKH